MAFLFPPILLMPRTPVRKRVAFEILGLDHVVLRAANPARLTRFYCDVLGCSVERDRPELGLTQLRAGVSLIDVIAVDSELGRAGGGAPRRTRHNMDHLCLRIEPFDENALVAHLVSNGVAVGESKSRFGADGYGPSLYISDPEGNVVELKGPPTRAGKS
jgi:glyoxylase I family protein